MLSKLTFNLKELSSDAFVRHFIEQSGGSIDSSGWIVIDHNCKEAPLHEKSKYLNIQFLTDAAYLKRVFDINRYLVFDASSDSEPLQHVVFTEPELYNYTGIEGKRIYLSPGIGNKFTSLEMYKSILVKGGATVYTGFDLLEELKSMDYCIFNTVNGEDFVFAYDNHITIGNTYWLMSLLTFGFTFPTSLQFWMPYPHKDPKCSNLLICLTNIEGKAREYLQKLCKLLGAEFSGNLTKNCTHLICGKLEGKKYEKALTWSNIQLVNVIWLEDCFSNWNYLDPKQSIYQHISKVLKPEEKLGINAYNPDLIKEAVELERIRLNRLISEPKHSTISSTILARSNDLSIVETENHPMNISIDPSMHSLHSIRSKSLKSAPSTPAHGSNQQQSLVQDIELATTIKNASNSFKSELPSKLATEPDRLLIKESVELHSDFTKKLGSPQGIQTFLNEPTSQTPNSLLKSPLKREIVESPIKSSKRRRRTLSGHSVCLMFTKGEPTAAQKRSISAMNFKLANDFSECTHLIAKAVKTTEKFLSAVGEGKEIVIPKWISTCHKNGEMINESDYRPSSDNYKDLNLNKSIENANKRALYEGYKFILSHSDKLPPFDAMTTIITSNGGQIVKMIKSTDIKSTIYVCANSEDKDEISRNNLNVKVLTKDMLFKSILFQEFG